MVLDGRTLFRANRPQDSSNRRGRGLWVNTNNVWCSNAAEEDGQSSLDVRCLMLRCQPNSLLIEFTSVFNDAAYSLSRSPPEEELSSTMCILIFLTATTPSHILTLAYPIIFPCFICRLSSNYSKGSNHHQKLLKCGQMKLQQLYRTVLSEQTVKCSEKLQLRTKTSISDITYQQMC